MGLLGVGGNGNVGGGIVPAQMQQNVVNAGQVQNTILTILGVAMKQNAKYMIDEPSVRMRIGFSVEKLGHPYNTTIPVITRYPEASQGFINLSNNATLWSQILGNSVSAIKDPVAFTKAFEDVETFLSTSPNVEYIQYGIRFIKIAAPDGIRFAYELEPSLATSFKNDLRF